MLAMPTRRRRAAARSAASACAIVSAIALVVVACLQFNSHGTEDASVMQDASMNAPAGRHLMGSALPSEDVAAAGVPPANTTCTPASGRAKFGSTSFWINAGVSLGTAWCVYACARCMRFASTSLVHLASGLVLTAGTVAGLTMGYVSARAVCCASFRCLCVGCNQVSLSLTELKILDDTGSERERRMHVALCMCVRRHPCSSSDRTSYSRCAV